MTVPGGRFRFEAWTLRERKTSATSHALSLGLESELSGLLCETMLSNVAIGKIWGTRGSIVVKALHYESKGRGFETR
jgi:hypothetical protein